MNAVHCNRSDQLLKRTVMCKSRSYKSVYEERPLTSGFSQPIHTHTYCTLCKAKVLNLQKFCVRGARVYTYFLIYFNAVNIDQIRVAAPKDQIRSYHINHTITQEDCDDLQDYKQTWLQQVYLMVGEQTSFLLVNGI